jgi:hypothetical protein
MNRFMVVKLAVGIACWMAATVAAPGQAPGIVVPRAGQPGPRMLMGTSVMDAAQNQLVKSLGFTFAQTDSDHLTVNEPQPGLWDWTTADSGLAAMQAAGMKWEYFPHFHWAPDWYRNSAEFVPSIGLRSGRKLAAISIWSPDIVSWFDRGYAAMAAHYGGGNDKVYAIYLGIHGDFGETIFPMGWHPDEIKRFGATGAGTADFWCGDDYARSDFRDYARVKYGTITTVNATWGTRFTSFDELDYPPAASKAGVDIISTPQKRRYWLDFIQWYYNSMTQFTGQVCRIARSYFPKSLLQIPIGGGNENVMYGQDTTALPKIARQYGVHVRSTHGGYMPFPQAYAAMLKRIATPCKIYGVPHWLEPPGGITPENEVSRIMEALSCGNYGFWDWGSNPVGATNVFRDYTNYFTREKPVVDVALFFPTIDHRLHPDIYFPQRLADVGAKLRDVMDFDMVDEELIADDGLKPYRALIWIEGTFIEQETLKTIAAWVERGGTLVYWEAKPPETVEGDVTLGVSLLGWTATNAPGPGGSLEIKDEAFLHHLAAHAANRSDASITAIDTKARLLATVAGRPAVWAMPRGQGWVIAAGGLEEAAFNELARDVTYNLSKLDGTKQDARAVDDEWDGVYATLLANGEVMLLNFNSEPRRKTVAEATIELPAKSLRSVMSKTAASR